MVKITPVIPHIPMTDFDPRRKNRTPIKKGILLKWEADKKCACLRNGGIEVALGLVAVLADEVGGDGAGLDQGEVSVHQRGDDSPRTDLKSDRPRGSQDGEGIARHLSRLLLVVAAHLLEVGREVVAVHDVDGPELVLHLQHLEDDGDDPSVGGERVAVQDQARRRHRC